MPSPTPRLRRSLASLLVLTTAIGCLPDSENPSEPVILATEATAASASGITRFRQVSSTARHTCAVTVGNRAFCWGFSFVGELGIGTTGPDQCGIWPCSTRPRAVAGGLSFRQVSAGGNFSCGVTTDERAYCWGQNTEGQLGDGTLMRLRLRPEIHAARWG